ncbi:hypothetical protein LINPERPRIM_LOCUS38223, partial [Linum perenne]
FSLIVPFAFLCYGAPAGRSGGWLSCPALLSSPAKVVKKARTSREDCSGTCVDDDSASHSEKAPSFRDKGTGFWTDNSIDNEVIYSDESDIEVDEDDPKCPTIRIPNEDKARVRRKFRHAIIVNTLDRCFPFSFMSRKLPQLWSKKGNIEVSDVGFGFYIVRFETVADHERALFGGPWMINDHYVVIQEWRPYFRPEETVLSTLCVWVRLPGLPFEYFDRSILKIIGDRIGRTVRIDHTTLEGSRGNFARICVEVDLSKPLLSKYRLRRRVRRVEYEGLHVICFNCGCYGHKVENCKQEPEVIEVENQTTVFVNPAFQGAADPDIHPEVEEDFGPWMQVKKNRRKSKAGPSAVAPPTNVLPPVKTDGKGNRFIALENMEGMEKSKDDFIAPDSVDGSKEKTLGSVIGKVPADDLLEIDPIPLEVDCNNNSAEIVLPVGKENLIPTTIGPGPSLFPQEMSIPAPLGLVANTSPGQPALGLFGTPIQPNDIQMNDKGFTHLAGSGSPSSAGGTDKVSSQAPQSAIRGFISPKNSKISKGKNKDSSGFVGLKLRDSSLRFGARSSSSPMEEM